MDLKHLRYFVAVAEELHFTRAAARLNMTQPPLSQIINRLEEDLGFKLLVRTKRSVILTNAGKVLLQESRAILAKAQFAVQHAERASRGDIDQNLKVVIAPWVESTPIFSEAFRVFGRRYPNVSVDFQSLPAVSASNELLEGHADLAFLTTPPDPPKSLQYRLVSSDAIVVALPEQHHLASKKVISLEFLESEPQIVVARDRIGPYYQLLENICQQAGFVMQVRHVIDHPQTAMALVAAESGVALVPASYENVTRPGVVYRPIKPTVRVNMIVAWRLGETSVAVQEFLSVICALRNDGSALVAHA